MKTPEELAEELDRQAVLYVSLKARNDVSYYVGMDCYKAGYQAAQEHAHATLEEAEAKMQELQDQLADADKVMPQWISVKDRLPEIDQDVLVIKDGLYGLACRKIVERQKLPPPQFNNIEIWEWDYGFEAREGQVTHWQKLPEPPKEEK